MGYPGNNSEASCPSSREIFFLCNDVPQPDCPKTSIASRAIDGLGTVEERRAVANTLLRYFDTDTIWYAFLFLGQQSCDLTSCSYHEEEPVQLQRLQEEHWKPLLAWSKEHLELDVKLFDSVLIGKQPEASKAKLLSILNEFDQWKMAGKPPFPTSDTYLSKNTVYSVRKSRLHLQKCIDWTRPRPATTDSRASCAGRPCRSEQSN